MPLTRTTYFLFGVVVLVITLSITVFNDGKGLTSGQQRQRQTNTEISELTDRYPVAPYDEVEPSDPMKRARLKKQKQRYDKDAPFSHPGPDHTEVAFRPEWQFDFPALPVAKSDAIVIGEVLNAEAHQS